MSTNTAHDIHTYLRDHEEQLLALLIALVESESPSSDPAAQDGPLSLLVTEFEALGYDVSRTPGDKTGGYLTAAHPTAAAAPRQLILGHCDTVWPAGTLASMPVVREGNVLRGPGVLDMKAGLAMSVFALRALQALGLEPAVAPVMLITSDEEISSDESREVIMSEAERSVRAFIVEPAAGEDGKLKTARKGVGGFEFMLRGRASHAGLDPQKGVNAIVGMSLLVPQIDALNDYEHGVSVTVTEISGGQATNVVPPVCRAFADVRVPTLADAAQVEAALLSLTAPLPESELTVSGSFDRPPLERTPANAALWERAQALGRELGLELEETSVGGGSDGNYTSLVTATLDGLGPVGDGAHATHEHVLIDRLAERAALLALLLLEPALDDAV